MPEVLYIKNVTAACSFQSTPAQFTVSLSGFPDQNPDEVVIRAINFNGEAADNFLYLVWSNITNDYIASFCGGNLSPQSPSTTVRLNAPVPNMLEFRLYNFLSPGTSPIFNNSAKGDLAIHLDFIKYKRVPPHA